MLPAKTLPMSFTFLLSLAALLLASQCMRPSTGFPAPRSRNAWKISSPG